MIKPDTLLNSTKKFIQEHGWLSTTAILLVLLDFFLVHYNPVPDILETRPWSSIVVWALPWVIPVVSAMIVVLDVVLQRRARHLQLIAWHGYNEPAIVKSYKGPRLDILEYVRGIDRVTNLRYGDSLFDVLISDVEFLARHHQPHNLLYVDKSDYEELWDLVPHDLRFRVESAGHFLGIPVRCGLNDIVVNASGFEELFDKQPSKTDLSYSELKLVRMIERRATKATRSRIGLWNWYLPTLGTLLLTEGVSLSKVWEQPVDVIKKLTDYIVQHKEHFLLFDQPSDATRLLRANQVLTVLGAGGWLIPGSPSERGNLIAVVPMEGVLMWVECAAIIDNREGNQVFAKDLIRHLLQPGTQELLAQRHAYRACPVTMPAIRNLSADPDWLKTFNIDRVFDFDTTKDLPLKDNVYLRRLPKDQWRNWESCWETVDAAVDHA